MTTSTYIEKINWRLVVIHLLGTIFIMSAAKLFVVLIDIDLFASYWRYGNEDFLIHLQQTDLTVGERLTNISMWTKIFTSIGLLIAFSISLTICLHKKIIWQNSIIVLLLGLMTYMIGVLEYLPFETITKFFGNFFSESGIHYAFILNGGLLLIVGLFIFFNKSTNKFVLKQTVMI